MSKIVLHLDRCQGYGNCVTAAPALFDVDDDGLVTLLIEDPTDEHVEQARRAVPVCPVAAISVED